MARGKWRPPVEQEDNAFEGGRKEKKKISPEDERVMIEVRETLQSAGYLQLHGIMNRRVESLTREIAMGSSLGIEDIRYKQGALNEIISLRSSFVKLGKEESYVGKTVEPDTVGA